VLSGQLTIGWTNDLIDRSRDRTVGRPDKPLATGELSVGRVELACGIAVAATVVLSLMCGLAAGLVHLGCVAAGWAYNLGLKVTVWSWAPYAAAFGGLTVFVALAGPTGALPPAWIPVVAALLGVGAHLINVLPDLADDEATGVRGLPHRLGARRTRLAAVVVLGGASLIVVLAGEAAAALRMGALLLVGALVMVGLVTRGRTPFWAAVGIALVDATLLVLAR
jgi:4-hydroxybenzoate polyprenyltransferase